MTDVALIVAVAAGAAAIVIVAIAILGLRPRLLELVEQAADTLGGVQRTLFHLEEILRELREKGVVDKVDAALSEAQGAVGRIDPLADDLQRTLSEARELLDDATQTSQSVRARVDDLAATQSELNALTSALADVTSEIRDRELATKLANVLTDTSLLAADIGVLTENANSYLEHGKPLVSNISSVVDSARRRAGGISTSLGALREGIRAGYGAWREGDEEA